MLAKTFEMNQIDSKWRLFVSGMCSDGEPVETHGRASLHWCPFGI